MDPPPPWVFAELQYFENILPLMDSLWCTLKDKVNIMGCIAAGVRDVIQDGAKMDFTKNSNLPGKCKNCK